jgi:hypothetical protein
MELGRYTKHLEHSLYHKDQQTKQYIFAKGADLYETARRIISASQTFRRPKFYCLDHTTFDAHVTQDALRMAHRFIKLHYPHDRKLNRLLNQQLKTTSHTRFGQRYKYRGTVNSGDVTTSIVNSLINYHILKSAFKLQTTQKTRVIVNGDDSIVITEDNVPINIKQLIADMRTFNMETKVDKITTDIHEVEFCRTQIRIDNDGIPMAVLDPNRILQTIGMTYKIHERNHAEYIAQVKHCYHTTYQYTNYATYFKQDTTPQHLRLVQHDLPLLYNIHNIVKGTTRRVYPHSITRKTTHLNNRTPKEPCKHYTNFTLQYTHD